MTQTESSTSETPLIDLAYQKLASIVGSERAQVGSLPLKIDIIYCRVPARRGFPTNHPGSDKTRGQGSLGNHLGKKF